MAFGKQKSKYYKDENEFGRKAFSITIIIALCIVGIILLWKSFLSLSYQASCAEYEPYFKVYCHGKGFHYKDVKYIKEDGHTDMKGLVFKVTDFSDSTIKMRVPTTVILYGEYEATFLPDHHVISSIGLTNYVYERR